MIFNPEQVANATEGVRQQRKEAARRILGLAALLVVVSAVIGLAFGLGAF